LLEYEAWLRSRQGRAESARRVANARVDEVALDREWARFMLANPRDYPLYRDTPLETVIRAVRARRLEAEGERCAFRYPAMAPPPNYSLFR
jgi:hypothetical protein